VASFYEVQPLTEDREVWWSAEDIGVLVNLADAGEYNKADDGAVKEEAVDLLKDNVNWDELNSNDVGSDDDASTDYFVFYRYR
jgi:hypothetical protein